MLRGEGMSDTGTILIGTGTGLAGGGPGTGGPGGAAQGTLVVAGGLSGVTALKEPAQAITDEPVSHPAA